MSVVLENQITITAPDTDVFTAWYKAVQDTPLPHTYTVNFHAEEQGWGVILSMQDNGAHWLLGSEYNTYGLKIWKWNVLTEVYDVAMNIDGGAYIVAGADVRVSFREMRFGDATTDMFYTIGLWVNGRHIITHSEHALEPLTGTIRFGLAVQEGLTRRFTNVRIPELTTFIDWLSLDPGEAPMSGLQRAIEGQHVKFYMRYNGAIRVWRPKASAISHVYTDVRDRTSSGDTRSIKTHLRMIGGYAQAEVHRVDLTRKYGHRFAEANNPYLLTEAECYEQAERAISRMEEAAETESFSTEYRPLLEPEDRVEAPDGKQLVISSRSVSYDQATADDSISARKYVHGEPAE